MWGSTSLLNTLLTYNFHSYAVVCISAAATYTVLLVLSVASACMYSTCYWKDTWNLWKLAKHVYHLHAWPGSICMLPRKILKIILWPLRLCLVALLLAWFISRSGLLLESGQGTECLKWSIKWSTSNVMQCWLHIMHHAKLSNVQIKINHKIVA